MSYTAKMILCAGFCSAFAANSSAQDYDTQVDHKASSVQLDATSVVDASGTLSGDYDPDLNPEGTQTRPGLFGGGGNQPIPTTTIFETQTILDEMSSGSMVLSPDPDAGVMGIADLSLDLLSGGSGATTLSVTIGFDTFHTVSPSFLYLGGFPITLPLGEVAQLTRAEFVQSGPATLLLSATEDPAVFDVTGAVAAQLDLAISLALPGGTPSETPIDAVPVVLPLVGSLQMNGDGSISVSFSADPEPISIEQPIDGVDFPAIPFELPTIGTETAGVLFTLSPQSIGFNAMLSLSINAHGTKTFCPADLNGDGSLDFFDISAFLGAFSAMDPAADFDHNGAFDFFDVSAFLAGFSAGCP